MRRRDEGAVGVGEGVAGDSAARVLVLLDLEADLARREVRLRVGAMLALCERCVGLGRWCVVQWNVLQVLIESIESID